MRQVPLLSKPLVSIIVPSYNQGGFIEDTVRSVLNQTYRPIELIIVDAQSTDQTINILHKFDQMGDISWTSEPDNGHADGVNKGFSRARGEIVAWLNSDDVYFSNDAIETAVSIFQKMPEMDVIYGDVAIISERNLLLRLFLLPSYDLKRIQRGNMISQPAVFMQKSVVKNEKLAVNQIGLDYEYWLRLGKLGCQFLHINKIIAGDRHYPRRSSLINRDLIDVQIDEVKRKLGLVEPHPHLMFFLDRFVQALCRAKGFALIIIMALTYSRYRKKLAFPLMIDSFANVLWRQLVRQVGKPM